MIPAEAVGVIVPDGLAWTLSGSVLTAAIAAAGAIMKLIRQGDQQAVRIAQLERQVESMHAAVAELHDAVLRLTSLEEHKRR